ncbi:MAG: glycosyltransferase family 4 protein [Candidatus Diapherotrites archaeon]
MNLCIVNDRFPPFSSGGGTMLAYNLAKELSEKHHVTVFTMDLGKKIKEEKFEVKRIKLNNSPSSSVGFLEFIKRIPKEIERKEFDVIHSCSAGISFFLPKNKLLITSNGSALSELKTLLKEKNFYFSSIKRLINSYFLELYSYQRAKRIIAISKSTAIEIEKDYFLSKKPEVIYNGFNKDLFNYSSKDEGYILFVGRLSQRKGTFNLLKAIKGAQARLHIIGDGELKQKIIEFTKKSDLQEKIKLLGWLQGKKLARQFKECSFLVCPSTYEPFPLVVLEAMACGKAVIAANVSGIPELIQDGKNGLLFNPFNENELKEKIVYLRDNAGERKRLGGNALKTARRFSWGKTAKNYLKVYRELK